MRRIVVNAALGGVFGVALAVVGFTITTWQYWLLFGIFLAALASSLLEARHD